MRAITLILSLFLAGCTTGAFPDVPFYIVDFGNQTCAEYRLIDRTHLKFKWVADFPSGKCQDVVGFDKEGFPKVKNWIRDVSKELNLPNAAPLSVGDEIQNIFH